MSIYINPYYEVYAQKTTEELEHDYQCYQKNNNYMNPTAFEALKIALADRGQIIDIYETSSTPPPNIIYVQAENDIWIYIINAFVFIYNIIVMIKNASH